MPCVLKPITDCRQMRTLLRSLPFYRRKAIASRLHKRKEQATSGPGGILSEKNFRHTIFHYYSRQAALPLSMGSRGFYMAFAHKQPLLSLTQSFGKTFPKHAPDTFINSQYNQ